MTKHFLDRYYEDRDEAVKQIEPEQLVRLSARILGCKIEHIEKIAFTLDDMRELVYNSSLSLKEIENG